MEALLSLLRAISSFSSSFLSFSRPYRQSFQVFECQLAFSLRMRQDFSFARVPAAISRSSLESSDFLYSRERCYYFQTSKM